MAGAGSGGVDRIGGSGVMRMIDKAKECTLDPITRDRLARLYAEERIRAWTNQRVGATVSAGGTPGPAASIGKVHQGTLNQQIQMLACDMLGLGAQAFNAAPSYQDALPYEVSGMLRSRANTIEGGTTEVNKNVIGEKVLGLPREPDPYHGARFKDTPR